jgi:hypothetical protein
MENEQKPKPGYLRHKLEGATDRVPPAAWEGIEARLERKKRRRIIFWWFLPVGMLLLGLAGLLGYQNWKKQPKRELATLKTNTSRQNAIEQQKQLATNERFNPTGASVANNGKEVIQTEETLPEKSGPEATEIAGTKSGKQAKPQGHLGKFKAKKKTPPTVFINPRKSKDDYQAFENKPPQTRNSDASISASVITNSTRRTKKNQGSGDAQKEQGSIVHTEWPSADKPGTGTETINAEPQTLSLSIDNLTLKTGGIQSPTNHSNALIWKLPEKLPEPVLVTADTAIKKKKTKKPLPLLNVIALQGGLSQQQVSLQGLPDVEPAFRPQLVLEADKLRTIHWGRFEFSKLLKISPTIMTGLGVQGSIYSQNVNATLAPSIKTPVSFAPTADSLQFAAAPNFQSKTVDFKRLGVEAGIHANIFWQPMWSPVGLKAQATLFSGRANWAIPTTPLLPNYSLGLFYTTPQRVYLNLDWQWWAPAQNMLPLNMQTKGKMSGINVGIGYYWK